MNFKICCANLCVWMIFFQRKYSWTNLRKHHLKHYLYNIVVYYKLFNSWFKYQNRQKQKDFENDIQRKGTYDKLSQKEIDDVQYYTKIVFICCVCKQNIFLKNAETIDLIKTSTSNDTEKKIR